MMMAFAGWIKKNAMVKFTRPNVIVGANALRVDQLRTVWTHENNMKVSEEINIDAISNKAMMISEKTTNAYQEISTLFAVGYTTILTQIGCFVPAKNV